MDWSNSLISGVGLGVPAQCSCTNYREEWTGLTVLLVEWALVYQPNVHVQTIERNGLV